MLLWGLWASLFIALAWYVSIQERNLIFGNNIDQRNLDLNLNFENINGGNINGEGSESEDYEESESLTVYLHPQSSPSGLESLF